MEVPTIQAERRTKLGSKYARQLRRKGLLPGIIYGHGEEPEPIAVPAHGMALHVQHGARVLNVEIEGRSNKYLIKGVQYDHLQSDLIHFDLNRVSMDERVEVEVGIELRGTPKGVHEGGILEQLRDHVLVECLAMAIPSTLHPSVAHLGVGDALLVKELELPEAVVVLDDPEERIAIVKILAIHATEAATEAAAAGPAEPERIGRVAEEEEGEGSDE